jgi:hypothetical protein
MADHRRRRTMDRCGARWPNTCIEGDEVRTRNHRDFKGALSQFV